MKKGKRKWVSLVVFAVLILVGFVVPASAAEWPTRPVQVFVWASAGGDTDLMNRTIWGVAEQQTGKTMNVSNATGALGGVAATRVWDARRDGHTVLGCSEMMHPLPVMGAHHTTSQDWDIFTIAGGSGIISVRPDSPYKTFEDLVKAAQQNPGKITVSHCPPGCIWHVKALLVGKYGDVNWKFVPYEGSAKAITALLTGEVDAVSSSLGEQYEFIRSGKIRPLITMEREPLVISELNITLRPALQVLPGVKNAPEVVQWLGTAIPADTPKEIKDAWAATLEKAFASDKMQEVIKRRVMKPIGWMPAESKVKLREADKTYMWILHDLGLTTKSPAEFNVPKP
jgi:tripartite-type tricarboxylate transporter receptor subunit TctC